MSQLVCPHCNTINRVPDERIGQQPGCGKCKQKLFTGTPVELDSQTFSRHIGKNSLPVVVDFWAPWCGPCQSMAADYTRVAASVEPRARFAKVNTEQQQQLAAQYQIRSIPTLMIFKQGQVVAQQAGAMNAGMLQQWVSQNI